MSILVSPDSAAAKEMRKWESQYTEAGPPGRPYVYHPYPAMLYKAGRINDGPLGIVDTVTVANEQEAANMKSRGYCVGPKEAIEAMEQQQLEFAKLSAEREYEKRHKLSEGAVAEVVAAENAHGSEHLPTIEETPIRRPVPASEATLKAAKERANRLAKAEDPNQESI
jgi:hypothetical protein